MDKEFERWYRNSKLYRPHLVPHGIANFSMVRCLYRHRHVARGVLLDIGARNAPYAEIFREAVTHYWAVDLYDPTLHNPGCMDAYADVTQLPLMDNSMDTVLMTQVLGYIFDPGVALREVRRVLAPGGRLILTYDQNGGQAASIDYFRFTAGFYQRAFLEAGFHIEVLEPRTGALGMIGENLSSFIYYSGSRAGLPHRPLAILCRLVQWPFRLLDSIWYDPNNPIGHIVIALKPDAGQ